jgi:ABC-2 type transport system permease protein
MTTAGPTTTEMRTLNPENPGMTGPPRGHGFFPGVGVVFSLEMRQRVRGVAWYVLLGVFVFLVLIVTVLLSIALGGFGRDIGGGVYSSVIYFVLLLGTLVAPALSGNSINGDRDAGTLATMQVTLVTTWQIVIGKFLAAWVTALAFLVASVPFLIWATVAGGLSASTIIVSILVLACELGVVAAIGVGLSGIIARPLFSIVLTYLAVAALSLGTLITFTLGGLVLQTQLTDTSYSAKSYDKSGLGLDCGPAQVSHYPVPRFDRVWGVLVANPYVVLADAVPTQYNKDGQPTDLFGYLKFSERSAQVAPNLHPVYNECKASQDDSSPQYRKTIDSTTPGWAVGMGIQLVLSAAALWGAYRRTRTPAARLPKGSRIA